MSKTSREEVKEKIYEDVPLSLDLGEEFNYVRPENRIELIPGI